MQVIISKKVAKVLLTAVSKTNIYKTINFSIAEKFIEVPLTFKYYVFLRLKTEVIMKRNSWSSGLLRNLGRNQSPCERA